MQSRVLHVLHTFDTGSSHSAQGWTRLRANMSTKREVRDVLGDGLLGREHFLALKARFDFMRTLLVNGYAFRTQKMRAGEDMRQVLVAVVVSLATRAERRIARLRHGCFGTQ